MRIDPCVRTVAALLALAGCGGDSASQADASPGQDGRSDGMSAVDGAGPGPDGAAGPDGAPAPDGLPGPDGSTGSCATGSFVLGDGTSTSCAFDMNASFDPGALNVVLATASGRTVVCHTLRETGCSGEGWYWTYEHQIGLCDGTCAALGAAGASGQVIVEPGCATQACASGGCTIAGGGPCTHATSYTCCSGRCDGDSCGSGLWGPCTSGFGCFEGTCQGGSCRCAPSQLQCGATCVAWQSDPQNCGDCGRVCTGGKECLGGWCSCPTGTNDCDGTCVSASDPQNCGGCGTICRSDQLCLGTCQCPYPLRDCGACVDTRYDVNNCDGCGIRCDAATQVCTPGGVGDRSYCVCKPGFFDCGGDGVCEDLQSDENNCGYCGHRCNGMRECIGGNC